MPAGLDLDRDIHEQLFLRTVPGAVDYLFADVSELPGMSVTSRTRDGLYITIHGPLRPLANVRYYIGAAIVLGDEPVHTLRSSARDGVLSALAETVNFRIAPIGDERWNLRDALESEGFVNSATDWDINIDSGDAGMLAEVGRLYWTKRFVSLQRAPASTTPVIASVMARLAKVEPGHDVLDPFCGAGTLLAVVADTAEPKRLLGSDHDRRWVDTTGRNLAGVETPMLLWRGDARTIPLRDATVDRVLSNLPFGKRVGSHIGNRGLYPAVMREIARVLPRQGRAVLLTEDKRLFTQTVQRTRGIRIIKQITFSTGGAHPSAYVVTTRRTR